MVKLDHFVGISILENTTISILEIVMLKGAKLHPFFISKKLKIYLKMYCKINYYYYLCINKHREQ